MSTCVRHSRLAPLVQLLGLIAKAGPGKVLYQDGKLVGGREVGPVDYTPWGRPLFMGHYHGLQEPYRVHGLMDDFKLWQRALTAGDIAAEAR